MPKKELAPLKSTVNFDPAAELARIDAELAAIDLRAGKLTRLALIISLSGIGVTVLMTLIFYLLYGWFVLWGAPAGLFGVVLGGWCMLQSGKIRAQAEFLMQQRRETRSLQKRAEIKAKG